MSFQINQRQDIKGSDELMAQALAYHRSGKFPDAEKIYQELLNDPSNNLTASYHLSVLYLQTGMPQKALPILQVSLQQHSHNVAIISTLGVALQTVGRKDEAEICFKNAHALNPKDIGILSNLARSMFENGNFAEALEYFEARRQINPNNPDFNIDAGRCHYELGNFQEALSAFETAVTLSPSNTDALCALGGTYWAIGQRKDAQKFFERALKAEPDNPKIIVNYGEFIFDEGNGDKALTYFGRALTLAPNYIPAKWRKSFSLLERGEYLEGWKLYASCLGSPDTRGPNRFAPKDVWDGKPVRNLLIWCEQGLGDSIQFIRYVALCKERVDKISVFCQRPLIRLLKSLPYIDEVSDTCDISEFDAHVPIMNLPFVFNTTLETIPAAAPYLFCDKSIKAQWAEKFREDEKDLKVGIVWAGGAHKGKIRGQIVDTQRSLELNAIRSWLALEGIKFYSLQKDEPAKQIAIFDLKDRLINYMGDVNDFADTAAIIENLDLVISVDTAVAHLAGALGKPVWILSRYNGDWRWLKNSQSSPWYPSARIFGQPKLGDWNSVIAEVEQALISLANCRL